MKTPKILHLSPTDIRYDSRILKELKSINSLQNINLKAFGINDTEGHQYNTNKLEYIKVFSIFTRKLTFLPRPIRYFLNLIEAFFRMVFPGIAYKPDIIHCHDTLYLPIARAIQIITKCKIIYDAHELESDKAGQSKMLSKYTLFIEKLLWKNIDVLITVSPSIIDWYNQNLGKKKSCLILNSPELPEYTGSEATKSNYLQEKFNIPQDKKIFVYLGIISEIGRGIKYYLEAFQQKDVDSHVVFVGYGEYAEEIKRISQKYKNIHYHSAVPHNKVVEIAASANVGLCLLEPVSLSDYYCLPNKLFEYAFSDLFVLASDLPDIKKIVEEYNLGKCCPLDSEDIYKKIKEIEELNFDQKQKKTLYPLSWEFQEKELLNLYQEILNNKN